MQENDLSLDFDNWKPLLPSVKPKLDIALIWINNDIEYDDGLEAVIEASDGPRINGMTIFEGESEGLSDEEILKNYLIQEEHVKWLANGWYIWEGTAGYHPCTACTYVQPYCDCGPDFDGQLRLAEPKDMDYFKKIHIDKISSSMGSLDWTV